MRRALILMAGLSAAIAGNGLDLAQAPAKAPAKPDATAAAAKPAPAERTLLSVKDVMRHIINPAAETFWAHSGEVDDDKGANDRVPTSQEQWNINIDTAAQLAEAGNLLMTASTSTISTRTWPTPKRPRRRRRPRLQRSRPAPAIAPIATRHGLADSPTQHLR